LLRAFDFLSKPPFVRKEEFAMDADKNPIHFLNQRLTRIRKSPPWTTALLVLSSAALGGIAVALWNRKALSTFRDIDHPPVENQLPENIETEDRFY